MTLTLVHRSGSLRGKAAKFDQKVIRIGRDADNDVVLDESMVSGHHAEIRRSGDRFVLKDLESTNGTFLNGDPTEKGELKHRDQIEIGADGPVLEFQVKQTGTERGPRLLLVSGDCEQGRGPHNLSPGRVRFGRGNESDFVVGRGQRSVVSTTHAELEVQPDRCEIKDLDSTNGTYVNGKRIRTAQLRDGDRIELGEGGPVFQLEWNHGSKKPRGGAARESERMFRHLERASKGGPAGDRTMMMLEVATKYYKRRRWPLIAVSSVVFLAAVAAGVYAYIQRRTVEQLTQLANFYKIRALEAEIVEGRRESKSEGELRALRDRRLKLEQDYDRYLEKIGWYDNKTPAERALMRLARRLGETDLAVPPDFNRTVLEYVARWRSTPRLRVAMERAHERQLTRRIVSALDQYGLPREFVFLALQESGFNPTVVGPKTRFGIAKGMWQFIPSTAEQYGLKLGPMKEQAVFDASDQRHNEDLSTQAAARYLSYIYTSKAAASGMLAIASYNYGETRIITKLDSLPNDPRQRNFWNFYRNGWIPEQTREYVMYIFAAALICEKPDLFQVNIEPCF